jgi:hypothetical protein
METRSLETRLKLAKARAEKAEALAEVRGARAEKEEARAKDARTRVKERVAKERGESGGGVWGRAVTGVTFLWPSLLFLFFLFFYFFCFFKINFEKKVKAFKMLRKKEKG